MFEILAILQMVNQYTDQVQGILNYEYVTIRWRRFGRAKAIVRSVIGLNPPMRKVNTLLLFHIQIFPQKLISR